MCPPAKETDTARRILCPHKKKAPAKPGLFVNSVDREKN